jgi:hypothetical protein
MAISNADQLRVLYRRRNAAVVDASYVFAHVVVSGSRSVCRATSSARRNGDDVTRVKAQRLRAAVRAGPHFMTNSGRWMDSVVGGS